MTGRQRDLDNLIELTTVTIYIEERGTFAAPTPPAPPAFGTRIEETFFNSIESLVGVGKGVVIGAVAIGPWLPVLAAAYGVCWLLLRRRRMCRNRV